MKPYLTRNLAPAFAVLLLTTSMSLGSGPPADEPLDWDAWRRLPVQNGGRHKPLDTLAAESLRLISNRSGFADPQSGERLDPTALYLMMLFDWQGFDHRQRDQLLLVMDWRSHYFHLHQADKWDEAPLLRVDFLKLREGLGLPEDCKYISPAQLHTARIDDPRSGQTELFRNWATALQERKQAGEELQTLEQKALELAERYWAYQKLRMGRSLELLPLRNSETGGWMPAAHLLLTKFDDQTDPGGKLRGVQDLLRKTRAARRSGRPREFNQASSRLLAAIGKLGPESGAYPSPGAMDLEVAYNHYVPFRFAWCLMLAAAVGMLLHLGSRWKSCYVAAVASYLAAVAAVSVGFTMRIMIAGRPPVTNMYESVIYVAAGVALLGLVFELIYRRKVILAAAAGVSAFALLLADLSPTILDPSLRPLEPVLRSNFWLVTHVMTITLSYAAFALALGIANITLGYYWARSTNHKAIAALSRFTYQAIQVGVLLLAAGTILGGVWADNSWGRFWGWDPKEVWALITLLGYLAVLHARFAGWLGQRGLALLSVACFALVVMAWYGVNFVLGTGLHSYGFGGGGAGYVTVGVVVQLLFAAAAVARSPRGEHPRAPEASTPGVRPAAKSARSVAVR